jgi:hypothetical protein
MLFLLILFTSVLALVLTWFGTGGLNSGGGNPVASVGVAFVVALLWARDFQMLERAYIRGAAGSMLRKLRLWSSGMGREEALLLRLSMEVELNRPFDAERTIEVADQRGIGAFARAWADGTKARLAGENERALDCFVDGSQNCSGLDRAELLCEASLVLLQLLPGRTAENRHADLQRAIEMSVSAGKLAREGGGMGRDRAQYLHAFQRGLVGIIQIEQGRYSDADRHLLGLSERARQMKSVRARRLSWLLRMERLGALRHTRGDSAMEAEYERIRHAVGLPSLRARLAEILEQRRQQQAQQARKPAAAEQVEAPAPRPRRPRTVQRVEPEAEEEQIRIDIKLEP